MLNDLFKLTIDKIYNPMGDADSQQEIDTSISSDNHHQQPYPVPGYKNSQNMWQKLCSLHHSSSKSATQLSKKGEETSTKLESITSKIYLTKETEEVIKLVNPYQLNIL
jgi:hypothetical protein